MRIFEGILLPALLLVRQVWCKEDGPSINRNEFETPLRDLFYFDDSDNVLALEPERGKVWRSANGGEDWAAVGDINHKDRPWLLVKNPYNNSVAIAFGFSRHHWITYDQGESWESFKTQGHITRDQTIRFYSFHAADSKKIILHVREDEDRDCIGTMCYNTVYYTDNGFKTQERLRGGVKVCAWAKGSDLFSTGDDRMDEKRILCIAKGKYSDDPNSYRLLTTDDYCIHEDEPRMSSGRTVPGFANMASAKGYIVAAARAEGSDEMSLYTTQDTIKWHKAEFGEHKVEEDGYTLLESTNYSLQVDVRTSRNSAMGALFSSNSNGTYFTKNVEHTNRNEMGLADFEKISNVQGAIMVNLVDNWKDVEHELPFLRIRRHLKSKISFDDGRTFESLKFGKEELHLNSITHPRNSGRIFSSPAPGLVMGVGNPGDMLDIYEKGDLFVSDDGGLTWSRALKEAHKYEFGDQGAVLVAVFDEGVTDQFMYSLHHGKEGSWKPAKLPNKFRAYELTTVPDSTSLRFILSGVEGSAGDSKFVLYGLNFKDMHERKCGKEDFELWHARVDESGKPSCVMGRKQSYRRRKADADCFVDEDFKDPQPQWETCKCTEADYECDFNFIPNYSEDGKKCVPSRAFVPKAECKEGQEKYKGSSGWRLIPGNECEKDGGKVLDEPIERDCSETRRPQASGKISSEVTYFEANVFGDYSYLERGDKDEETIVMITGERDAYVTHDHGKKWEKAVDEKVEVIYPHQHNNDRVYFITRKGKTYYSENRAKNIHHFDGPDLPNFDSLQVLGFHSHNPDWLLWNGLKDGHATSYVSTSEGQKWDPLVPFIKKCQFMWSRLNRDVSEQLVYCEQYAEEDPDSSLQLVSSDDFFKHKDVPFKRVVSFATMAEFILVASKSEDGEYLKLDSSIDGKTFADAKFPPKFDVGHQQAYTVLESSTHSIFLFVSVNNVREQEFGAIVKSNSNGTSYVMSVVNVNRDSGGYVDFEKMASLEGVATVNIVANREAVEKGDAKLKKTMMTHNDGADWALIEPPRVDSDGKKFECDGSPLEKCSLHLHGYTERDDPRNEYSSPSATGLMVGVGNVGEHLGRVGNGDTFMSSDGGVTWKEVRKGQFMWAFGDQGSVIAIVQKLVPTNVLYYSLNEGGSWEEYQFSDSMMQVSQITTVPSGVSLNFLLWGKDSKKASQVATINLDFTGLFSRQCELNEDGVENDDYYLWSPRHPNSDDNCLFGHVAQYHRKKPDAKCYNGPKIDRLHNIERNCSCTTKDFECDYNYERRPEGCKLVEGLEPADPKEVCKNGAIEYWDPTGYRKIPISTCQGGKEMEYTSQSHPCPGHEEEYNRKHSISGFGLFLAIVAPIGTAVAVGWYVWRNWDGKFGRIRLGEPNYSRLDSDHPLISWPVAAVSGLVAVLTAIPLLARSLWRSATGRFGGRRTAFGGPTYTSRSSFARGRGDYAVMDPDEGELLGDDSDEDA